MTKTKSTKRALLLSALSLLVCVSMLIGSTFAWFTDSVTSAGNTIQSGTLKIALVDADGNDMKGKIIEFATADKRAQEKILWEPGCTYETKPVYVENKGNLALKYQIVINGLDGNAKLLEAIEWTVTIDGAKTDLSEFEGTLIPGQTEKSGAIVLSGHMKEEAGNEYQGLTVEGISISVFATQYTYEKDSFDDQYDADAKYPPIAWDGSVDISWFDAGKTEFTISNGAQLAGMAKLGNQLGGKTITLDSDVDLGGKNWTPINIFAPEQSFTFDGGNHTIYNLNVTGRSDGGLFDNSVGTIKNLKLSDAQIESGGRSAILAGRHYGDIINCHVKDSTIEDSYWAVGGIVGQLNSGNIKNCSVTNVNVKSNGGVGGIVGVLNETSGTRTIENCSVIGGTIENTGLYGSSYSGGGIVGMINISNSTVNITGCNSTATLKGEYIFEICPPADDDITLNIN